MIPDRLVSLEAIDRIVAECSKEIDKEIREEHTNERADGLFDNWKSDNLKNLKEEFIEDNYDFFLDYCKEAFKEREK